MTNGDDDGHPIADPSDLGIDVIGGFYDELHDDETDTIDDWKARDVENSPVAWMNQFLNGGPLEDFDRFVLTANLNPASEDGDPYADDHRSIDFSPVVWSLLLKEARNLPSDEKLEFYLKGREDVAQMAGFESVDDVPRNSTFWRAYADTNSNDPRLDDEAMDALKTEARKLVNHAKWAGFKLPDGAEEHLFEFGKQDYMEIAHDLLEKTVPHIAFGRDPSRTTYTLPSIVSFLAHLALEGAFPENGSDTFTHMNICESGGTGADNLYHYIRKRTAEDWFDRFLRANAELLEEARSMGHFENASEVGLDTTGIPWFGDTSNNFVDGTKPSRNYAHSFHFTTIGIVGDEASLSLAAHHLKNRTDQDRILRAILQRVQDMHYFSDDQLDVEIERAYLDKGFYGGMHVTALRETDTEFLIKSRKVEPVKSVIDGLEEWNVDCGIMQDYEIGDLKQGTNIFIRPSEKRAPRYDENTDEEDKKYGRWVAFVTDIDPVTADREKLARQFRNRWGVETQYRQFKHNFYAPTKSPNGRVRAFHFNLAQLFYNIWVIVNLELRDRYGLAERRPVTADDVLHAIRDEAFELDDLPE